MNPRIWGLALSLVIVAGGAASALEQPLGTRAPTKGTDHVQFRVGDDGREGGETIDDAFPIAELPYLDTGHTCSHIDDYDEFCPYTGSTSPDVVYSLVVAEDIALTIDFCGSGYDTKVYVYDTDLNVLACNDDFYFDEICGIYVSKIDEAFIAGGQTVYIVVDGYGGDCGPYEMEVYAEIYVPCIVECPPGSTDEGEPPLQDGYEDAHNGGCNSPDFGNPMQSLDDLGENQTLCGRSGWYTLNGNAYRDTDWFTLTLDPDATATVTLRAEEPTYLFELLPHDCYSVGVEQILEASECETVSMTVQGRPDGVAWIWVGPTVFAPPPDFVGNEYRYRLVVDAEPLPPAFPFTPASDYSFGCQRLEPGEWRLDASLVGFSHLYDLAPALPGQPATWGPDGILEFYLGVGESIEVEFSSEAAPVAGDEPGRDEYLYAAVIGDPRLGSGSVLAWDRVSAGYFGWFQYTATTPGYHHLLFDRTSSAAMPATAIVRLESNGPPPPPGADTCTDAAILERGGVALTRDLGAATNAADPGRSGCVGNGDTGADLFFRVDLLAGSFLDVIMTGYGAWDEELYLIGDCDDPAGSCVAGGAPEAGGVRVQYTAEVDETLWLVCDSYGLGPGIFSLVGLNMRPTTDTPPIPAETCLHPVHPNPFNPLTTVRFELAREQLVRVVVYDLFGRRVATLVDERRDAGPHVMAWDGRSTRGRELPSGTYILRLEAEEGIFTRKLMLVR